MLRSVWDSSGQTLQVIKTVRKSFCQKVLEKANVSSDSPIFRTSYRQRPRRKALGQGLQLIVVGLKTYQM